MNTVTLHHDVKELLNELNGIAPSVIFGGYLRDLLLGHVPNDVDIVTNIPIEQIETMFKDMEKASRRVTISGHNVFSFKLHRTEKIFVEIVCITYDVFQKPFEADYTLNSLLHDGNQLIDLTKGLEDIKNTIIREVNIDIIKHDLSERPYLWLKTLRLASVTGYTLSDQTFSALQKNKTCVEGILPGIFQTEGHKMINGKHPLYVCELLAEMELIRPFTSSYEQVNLSQWHLQPAQKLCLLALLSSKETIDDLISFYQFPTILSEKYEELFYYYHTDTKWPNRLKNQLIMLQKIMRSLTN